MQESIGNLLESASGGVSLKFHPALPNPYEYNMPVKCISTFLSSVAILLPSCF